MPPHAGNAPACSAPANGSTSSSQSTLAGSGPSPPVPTPTPPPPSTAPVYSSILLSISGDSKISLQHASVQQLTVIPEGKELVLASPGIEQGGQSPQICSDEEDGGDRSPYQPGDYYDEAYGVRDMAETEVDDVDDDDDDGDDDSEMEPAFLIQDPAPDGGYGWVIVFSSFMCNLIVDGIGYTFGLFVDLLVKDFNSNESTVTLCASLLSGFYLSVGPIVSALANRFGCRAVAMSGAIIAALAFFLSTLTTSISMLIIVYGIMGGCGFGTIYLPALVSVGYYFNTKRAFATGIAVCGSGVGAFIFAPFVSYLLSFLDWRQTFLVLGSLVALCTLFASLVKPLELHAQTVLEIGEEVIDDDGEEDEEIEDGQQAHHRMFRKPLMQRIAEEKRRRLLSHSNSQFLLMMQQNGSIDIHDPSFGELRTRLMMNTEPGVHSTLYLDQLFGGGHAAGVQTGGTPSRTSTPSLQSAHQSLAQLGDNTSRHQLSPIIEKKLPLAESVNASDDRLTSSDDSSEEETITIVAKTHEPYPGMPSFEPPTSEEEDNKKKKQEDEEKQAEIEDIISQLSMRLDIPESIQEEPEPEDEDEKTESQETKTVNDEEKEIVSIVSEKTPTNTARGDLSADSIQTLPQSPLSDAGGLNAGSRANGHLIRSGGSFVGSTTSGSVCRSRRSMTVRSDRSDCSSFLHPPAQMALSASGGLPRTPGTDSSNIPLSHAQLPVQVILSTCSPTAKSTNKMGATPGTEGSGESRLRSSQRIPIRPMAKKDIFYTGSTKALYASDSRSTMGSRLATGEFGMGQSIVSIPTRDIIEKVWKQLREQEEKMAGGEEEEEDNEESAKDRELGGFQLRRQRNFCNKVAKIICPFRENIVDCFRGKRKAADLNELKSDGDEDIETGLALQPDGAQQQQQQQQHPKRPWYRRWPSLPMSMKSILREMLDMSLLKESRAFTLLAISNVVGMLGFYVPYFFITQYVTTSVLDDGAKVTKDKASLMISVMGLTNMIGRLFFGWLSDVIARCGTIGGFEVTALALNNACVLLAGLAVCAMPFCTTYMALSAICLIFGLFISAYICLTSIILVDMLGLDRLTNAFGLLSLFRGVASMIGPPVAGAIFNYSSSYIALFVSAGSMLVISAIMAFFIEAKPPLVPDQIEQDKINDDGKQQKLTSDDELEP